MSSLPFLFPYYYCCFYTLTQTFLRFFGSISFTCESKTLLFVLLAQVSVRLKGADGLCSEAQPGELSEGKTINVLPNEPGAVKFVIIPLEAKRIPIEVHAFSNLEGKDNHNDAVKKYLNVYVSIVLECSGLFLSPLFCYNNYCFFLGVPCWSFVACVAFIYIYIFNIFIVILFVIQI